MAHKTNYLPRIPAGRVAHLIVAFETTFRIPRRRGETNDKRKRNSMQPHPVRQTEVGAATPRCCCSLHHVTCVPYIHSHHQQFAMHEIIRVARGTFTHKNVRRTCNDPTTPRKKMPTQTNHNQEIETNLHAIRDCDTRNHNAPLVTR